LLLFYAVNPEKGPGNVNPDAEYKKRMYYLKKEKEHRVGNADTIEVNKLIETLQCSLDSIGIAKGDSLENDLNFTLGSFESNNPENQDSLGWFERLLLKRTEERRKEAEEKHQGDVGAGLRDFLIELLHKLPQLIFLSLPFFALFLKMLYFRSKRRLYVEHLIFSIYQYSYLYTIMAVYFLLSYVADKFKGNGFDTLIGNLNGFMILYLFIYLILAMKRFYVGRWRYLIPKYFILMFLMFIAIIFLGVLVSIVAFLL